MSAKHLTILFSGMLAGDPCQGGATWAVIQYVLGFQRLGHDVYFVEPVEPGKLLAVVGRATGVASASRSAEPSPSVAYFHRVTRAFGLPGRCALLGKGTRQTVGMLYDELRAV